MMHTAYLSFLSILLIPFTIGYAYGYNHHDPESEEGKNYYDS